MSALVAGVGFGTLSMRVSLFDSERSPVELLLEQRTDAAQTVGDLASPIDVFNAAMLRRSASMRLIARRGAGSASLGGRTAPACRALRCAMRASS